MKDEIWATIRKMKSGKATGPDSISVELLKVLENHGTDKITTIVKEIYDTAQIPSDISKPVLKALPKKPGEQNVNYIKWSV